MVIGSRSDIEIHGGRRSNDPESTHIEKPGRPVYIFLYAEVVACRCMPWLYTPSDVGNCVRFDSSDFRFVQETT